MLSKLSYKLRHVTGDITIICSGCRDRNFGGGKLEGIIDTLDINSGPKALLFYNENLTRIMSTSKCADSIFLLFSTKKINSTTSELDRTLVFEYSKGDDNITLKEYDSNIVSFNICRNYTFNITIKTDEKTFNDVESHSFAALKMNSMTLPRFWTPDNFVWSGFHILKTEVDSHPKIEGSCRKYVENKIKEEYHDLKEKFDIDLTILDQPSISGLKMERIVCNVVGDRSISLLEYPSPRREGVI